MLQNKLLLVTPVHFSPRFFANAQKKLTMRPKPTTPMFSVRGAIVKEASPMRYAAILGVRCEDFATNTR